MTFREITFSWSHLNFSLLTTSLQLLMSDLSFAVGCDFQQNLNSKENESCGCLHEWNIHNLLQCLKTFPDVFRESRSFTLVALKCFIKKRRSWVAFWEQRTWQQYTTQRVGANVYSNLSESFLWWSLLSLLGDSFNLSFTLQAPMRWLCQ